MIVGRTRELDRIADFVTRLSDGASSLVITGEAGLGKTVLWQQGCDLAADAGVHVLSARPTEDDAASPGEGLSQFWESASPPAGARDGDLETLADRFAATLTRLRGTAAVLLAVDDLQWLDESTSRLLRRMLRRFGRLGVSLLATVRTAIPGLAESPAPDLARWEADILDLGAVSADDLARILRDRGVGLPRPQVDQVHAASGGNPFIALELARRWRHHEEGPVQPTAAALLATELRSLLPEELRLLQLVALAGPMPAARLGGLAGGDALAALDGGLARFLTADDHFVIRCAHPLIAAAARGVLSGSQRRDLHARIAAQAQEPVARARHLAASQVEPDVGVAGEVAEAARVAARQGSPGTAADLVAHSRRLTPPQMHETAVKRGLAEMRYRAAAGEYARAIRIGDDLITTLNGGRLHAEVLSQRVLLEFGDAEVRLRAAIADNLDDAVRCRLLDLLGWQLGLFKGRLAEGIECCEQALELARVGHDRSAAARAGATLSTLYLLSGAPRPNLLTTAETGSDDALLRVRPSVFRARQAMWQGDLATARRGFGELREEARVLGSEFQRPYRLRDVAMLELAAGRLRSAEEAVSEAITAAEEASNEQARVWLAYPEGIVAALGGASADVQAATARLADWALRVDEPLRFASIAEIDMLVGAAEHRWGDAVEHGQRALARLDACGIRHPAFVPVLPRIAEAAVMAGDRAAVHGAEERLREMSERLAAPNLVAMAAAAAGHRALVEDEPDRAREAYLAAARTFSDLGYRMEAARAGYFLGLCELRRNQRIAATETLQAALAVFEGERVLGWDTLCREHLDRLSGAVADDLTRAERAVVGRVRAGLRNKEIAAELFLSVSTVEAHLTRVYRKLGVRGRAELVAKLSGNEGRP